jgi:hypothetical protein
VTVPPTHAGARRVHGSRTVVEHAHLAGRTPVASFTRYADAEHTLTLLAGTRFPMDRLALIGGDLKLVDDGSGRITGVRAAAAGAAAGGWMGALLALYTFVLDRPPVGALASGVCWGVAIGGLFGVTLATAGYATFGRTRDHGARRRLVAARYELYADGDVAASAWRLLFTMHPAGLTLVDRVPVEVVAPAVELTLIEPMEPVSAPAAEPAPADAA